MSPFVLPVRGHKQVDVVKDFEMISDKEAAEMAAQRRKERVLVPIIFRERVLDGTGVYKYSSAHHQQDIDIYTKQIELQKQDVSILEFLEEGENEQTVSGRVLMERYGERIRNEKVIKEDLYKRMEAGEDLTMEHPADVFVRVSDPNARSFQEAWENTKRFEYNQFFVPGRTQLMHMLEQSRTRRHFLRAVIILRKLDRLHLEWSHADKLKIIAWSEKHRYPDFLLTKFENNVSLQFFSDRTEYEHYLSFLIGLRKSATEAAVLAVFRDRFRYFSKDGYHRLITAYFHRRKYDQAIALFKEMLFEAQIPHFSLALWNVVAKAMILSGQYEGMEEMVEALRGRYRYDDSILARQVLCLLAQDQEAEAKQILQNKEAKRQARRILKIWSSHPQEKMDITPYAEKFASLLSGAPSS